MALKKMYRLTGEHEKKIAGICAGIADAYSFDPTLVRLTFVFVTAVTMFWPGILTYCVAWWLIPEGVTGEGPGS